MEFVRRFHRPALERPALIAAFEGWNDAGEAASTAVGALARAADAQRFAEIEAEEFVDYQVTRPTIRTDEEGARQLEWPELRLSWASLAGADRDVVLLQGPEPNLRWRSLTRTITGLAEELGVGLVITIGALQVDVPHTRPVPVTGTATDAELGARLTLRRSGYEGPTGITGVLHAAAVDAGLDAVSLWAGVPHYLAAMTYVPGAHALAERARRLLRAPFDLDELAVDADRQRGEIDDLVGEDGDLAEYVAELESRVDEESREEASGPPGELPAPGISGDELAAAFERYLRNRGDR